MFSFTGIPRVIGETFPNVILKESVAVTLHVYTVSITLSPTAGTCSSLTAAVAFVNTQVPNDS